MVTLTPPRAASAPRPTPTSDVSTPTPPPTIGQRMRARFARTTLTAVITWFAAACFIGILIAVLASVIVTAFSTSWGGTWWPDGFTLDWFGKAWQAPGLSESILTTFEVAFGVVFLALLFGVPAGYVLARKNFPGKTAVLLLFLFPVILPPLTYAVQLAALMYKVGLGGSLLAVILVNLVPVLPLVILITTPFVEQISPEVESAARVFGANSFQLFRRVLVPLLVPGIVAAAVLSFVRVLASFELTFFVSNAHTQTLVVTIFGAMSDPGGPPPALTAAMTVFYMVIAFIGLAISLRFSNPAQALSRTSR